MDLIDTISEQADSYSNDPLDGNAMGDIAGLECKCFSSGIVAYWSSELTMEAFCRVLVDATAAGEYSGLILIYPLQSAAAETMREAAAKMHTSTNFVGCSTAGAVTPFGLQDDATLVALILPARHFTVVSTVLEQVSQLGMNEIVAQVRDLKNRLSSETNDDPDCQIDAASCSDVFAVNLIDGLSYSEEAVTAALHRGLDGLPLVGGSAGDDLEFTQTTQFFNGETLSNSAVLTLIRSRLPFRAFTNNNFVPTEYKLVVTDSDPDHRNVREFNARPAAIEYANAVGLDPDSLSPNSFASHPVVVRVGGEYYCRSIQKCEDDHSLSFFCAIDNGIVLTIAKPTGMVKSTRDAIDGLRRSLGELDMILGFDCILRRLDAHNRDNVEEISALYREANVVGFGTYGEQFNSMHINQTFTGIAFGKPISD